MPVVSVFTNDSFTYHFVYTEGEHSVSYVYFAPTLNDVDNVSMFEKSRIANMPLAFAHNPKERRLLLTYFKSPMIGWYAVPLNATPKLKVTRIAVAPVGFK